MSDTETTIVNMKPASGIVFRTAQGRQLSLEEAVERYVDLTFKEIKRDLLYYRQPHSAHEVSKLPPAAIAALTHKCEEQGLVVLDPVEDPVSERTFLVVRNPHFPGRNHYKNRKVAS